MAGDIEDRIAGAIADAVARSMPLVPGRGGCTGSGKLRKAAAAVLAGDDEGELAGIDDEELENLLALGLTELAQIMPSRIDAVSEPASGVPVLMMKSARGGRPAAPGPRLAARLVKAQPEHRVTMHVSYPVNRADRSRAMDGFQDVAGPDAVEQACWSFMKSGQAIGLDHADGTEGAGRLVECSIYRGPAYVMKAVDGSEQEIATGDWLIAVQWDEPTWRQIKSGRYNGVSMQGGAVRKKPSRETLAALRKAGGAGGKKELTKKTAKKLQKAARSVAREARRQAAPVRKEAKALGRRLDQLEKSRLPRCGACGKRAKGPLSKYCVKCGGSLAGTVAKGAAPAALTSDEAVHLAAVLKAAQQPGRLDAMEELISLVGPDTVAKIMAGEMISPEQFTRAYLSNGRASQSAGPDQKPRIPMATHVISADDFRRPPLGAGQSRPAPGSAWPGSGGQQGGYGPGPGAGTPYQPGQAGVRPALASSHPL